MKVRILKQPTGSVHGVSLSRYKAGSVYDVPATIAEYLIVEGLARMEMRKDDSTNARPNDERRKILR